MCGSEKAALGQQHVQMALLFLGQACSYMCRINLSVCLVNMTAESNRYGYQVFPWSQAERGLVLSAFFWGYTLTQVPGGMAAQRFGAKRFQLLAVGGSGLATLVLPLAARLGGWRALCALRSLQGLMQGMLVPSTHCMLGRWVPPRVRARNGALVYSGQSFGTVSMMALAGVLADSPRLGWPAGFYLPGALSLAWAVAWLILGADSPATCSRISQRERDYIEREFGDSSSGEERLPVPWRSVLTSVPLLCLVAVNCAYAFGHWTMLTQIPSFMSEVLHFDIKKNGLFSALPYLCFFCTSMVVAWSSQWLIDRKMLSVAASRKLFTSLAQWGGAAALLLLGSFAVSPLVAVALLVTVVSLESCVLAGFNINHIDLSPNFSGVLIGMTNGAGNVMGIVAPNLVSAIIGDTLGLQQEEIDLRWSRVFITAAFVLFTGNVIFLIGGRVEVQSWNNRKVTDHEGTEDCDGTAMQILMEKS